MKLKFRLYNSEEDFWHIRNFLREVYLLNDRREISWQVYRWDYWRWHGIENIGQGPLEKTVFLWETSDGKIAAVLNPENDGVAYMQAHPDFISYELEEEMLSLAEEHLAKTLPNGKRKLWVVAHDANTIRQGLLKQHGFELQESTSNHHSRLVNDEIPEVKIGDEYTIRSLGDIDEHPARSWVSWKAFHPDEPDKKYQGWTWYQNVQRCPLYRRDLDLVAALPNGEIAAFCTIWFDDVTRTASFEPVGVHPDHQRKGLGRAIMYEGLRRIQELGATLATVGSEEQRTLEFYSSIGFSMVEFSREWKKEFE
ncbi:MAG: GNAT family N-acetyltransferase [Chloroflexi bacterium]|nr:GNAT family N-acetyltransferase [Chloroflexota bacterium]